MKSRAEYELAKARRTKEKARVKFLRRKVREGRATPINLAELEAYERNSGEGIRTVPLDGPIESDNADPVPPVNGTEIPPDDAKPQEQAKLPIDDTPPAPSTPLPTPPRVDTSPPHEPSGRGGDGRWQSKYGATQDGGREQICVGLADGVMTVLAAMDGACAEVGAGSFFAMLPQPMLRDAWVLTWDQVLPERIKAAPPIVAAVGTATVMSRRFMHRKKIADHVKTKTDRAKHQAFRDGQAERMNNPAPAVKADNVVPIVPNAAPNGAARSTPIEVIETKAAQPANDQAQFDPDGVI